MFPPSWKYYVQWKLNGRFQWDKLMWCMNFPEGFCASRSRPTHLANGRNGPTLLHFVFFIQKKLILLMVQKSCTTWDLSNLVNNGINYVSTDAIRFSRISCSGPRCLSSGCAAALLGSSAEKQCGKLGFRARNSCIPLLGVVICR